MNCIDNECKHLYSETGEMFCELTHAEVPDDIDEIECKNFLQAHTCINCMHSKITVYETGTIDDIEYRCPFQNNKLIYDDSWYDEDDNEWYDWYDEDGNDFNEHFR